MKYDLIISLGAGCPTADALKKLNITEKTYPFDWSDSDGNASEKLLNKCNLIKNHFENAFNFEDFIEYWTSETNSRGVKNKKTGLHYWHDFPWEKSLKDFWPEFYEKYQRRVNRLYDDVESAKDVLFVYEDISRSLPVSTMKEAITILKETFPNKNINLMVLSPVISGKSNFAEKIDLGIDNLIVVACCKETFKIYEKHVVFVESIIAQIFDIDYINFCNDEDILCLGFSENADLYKWSVSDIVFLRLNSLLKAENLLLKFKVRPFIVEGQPSQKVLIKCNGQVVSETVFDTAGMQSLNLIVPNNNNGVLDFIFEFDNPKSPKELGVSPDERKLALAFYDVTISKA